MRWMLVLLAMSALGLAACASSSPEGGAMPTPSPAASPASTLLDPSAFHEEIAVPGAFVVNVHTPYQGEIEGTDAFVPFDQIRENAGQLPADKSAPLYVYCRSGSMSAKAAPVLRDLGYTNIFELEGGMDAWTEAGFSLTGGGDPTPTP